MNFWDERNLIGPAADIEAVEEDSVARRPPYQVTNTSEHL